MVAEAIPFRGQIPVMVCTNDPISRAGLVSQLRAGGGFTITADDDPSDEAVALLVADELDEATATVVRTLRARGKTRIVALLSRIDDRALLLAAEAGVTGIVRRSEATAATLASAIRAAVAGDGTLPPDLLGRLLRQVGALQRQVLSPRGLTLSGLSEREVAVLRLLAEGCDTAEVGRRLFYSERTVKNIIHDVTSRLDLHNRTQAVAYAIKQGLL